MVEPHESHFWQMVAQSGLVAPAHLQICWEAIPPELRAAGAIDARLALEVVKAGFLTPWQAQQIARGRGKGLQINKYNLLGVIGQGGMGKVFLASDTRLNRRVALKVLSRDRLNDERAVARFRREARLGARLEHEHLVRIYDEGEFNGRCYLIMEYIEGPSIGQLLAWHGPMPMSTASRLARQVALGLEHARQKGMIHRDVNPNNILVTQDGIAKLADMGLAIEFGDEHGVTLEGSLLGNYDYVSPEQVHHSRNVDTRSDIYSLGCTLYHMISGRVPFPSTSLPEKIHALIAAEPAPLSSIVAGLPNEFEELLSKMMRKLPEERHQKPIDVAKALEPFLEGLAFRERVDPSWILSPKSSFDDPSQSATAIIPSVMSASDEESPSSRSADRLLASPSEFGPPDPTPTQAQPDAMTWPSKSGEFGQAGKPLADPASSSHESAATRSHDLGPRWSWVEGSAPPRPRRRIALLVLLAAAILSSMILAARSRGGGARVAMAPQSASDAPSEARQVEAGGGLAVVILKDDGTEEAARDLEEALGRGGLGNLRIILRGRGPIRFESEGLEVRSGTVTIEADAKATPLLIVGMSGGQPFLRVGARATLKLKGLSVRGDYAKRDGKASPLIEVKGTLEMTRCALWTIDRDASGGAVSSEGPRLSATGCWIGGFRQGLDVSAFAGTEVVLEQCMLIQEPDGDPWNSWAIRIRHESTVTGVGARTLILQRCTIRGACLLRADDFQPSAPLGVTIEGTAIQGGVLLAWKSEAEPVQGGLNWSGRNNLYDLSRASRTIRLDGPSTTLSSTNDADSWARQMEERGSRDRSISFPDLTPMSRSSPRPDAFPIQDVDGGSVGANPIRVGPDSSLTELLGPAGGDGRR